MRRTNCFAFAILALSLIVPAVGVAADPKGYNVHVTAREAQWIKANFMKATVPVLNQTRLMVEVKKSDIKKWFSFKPKLEIKKQGTTVLELMMPLELHSKGKIVVHNAAIAPQTKGNVGGMIRLSPALELQGSYAGDKLISLNRAVEAGTAKVGVYGHKTNPQKATVSIRWNDKGNSQSIIEVLDLGPNKTFHSGTRGGKLEAKPKKKVVKAAYTVEPLPDFKEL